MASAAKYLRIFQEYPLFTTNDAAKLLHGKSGYPKIFLYRFVKNGLATRISKGKYSVQEDPITFASLIYSPSYIALWSALTFHGLTEQIPKDIFVVTIKNRKSISYNGIKIHFFRLKHMWGFEKINYKGFSIFVSDIEKTIIDCLLTESVPIPIIYDAIENAKIDIDRLVAYLNKIRNKALAKRIGFLMEMAGNDISEKLKGYIDNNYTALEPSNKGKGKKNKKWRVIENIVIP